MQASLYRKYRPSTWGELSGQRTAVRMLRNAIQGGSFSHAWLFSGPRGTGKTTCAKIVAKALNCKNPVEGAPCGTCPPCEAFSRGAYADYIELDAASHRGIEEFRRVSEMAHTAPMGGRDCFKVFVIDEAHMLTEHAANAFLKTLEEPPPWVVFILATTEPEKILPTIRSRCIRVQFQLLAPEDVRMRLSEISEAEGLEVEESALMRIAERGGGGLRDTLTLLEQAVHLCGTKISLKDWQELMGESPASEIDAILKARFEENGNDLLKRVRALLDAGAQPEDLLSQLMMRSQDFLGLLLKASNPAQSVPDWVLQSDYSLWRDFLAHLGLVSDQMQFSPHRVAHLEAGLLAFGPGASGGKQASDVEVETLRRRVVKLEESLGKVRRFLKDALKGSVSESGPEASAAPAPMPQIRDSSLDVLAENQRRWEMLRREMKKQDPLAYALLDPASVDESQDKLRIYWPIRYQFHHKRIQEERPWKALRGLIERFFSKDTEVELVLGDPPGAESSSVEAGSGESASSVNAARKAADRKEGGAYVSEDLKQRLMKDPGLARLVAELDASIENVL